MNEEQADQPVIKLRSFKVLTEGETTPITVESMTEQSLVQEFQELGLGTLKEFQEVDSTGKPIGEKNVKQSNNCFAPINSSSVRAVPLKDVPVKIKASEEKISFKEVKLSSGEIVRVFTDGTIQEQTWKDLTTESLITDVGIRLMKNGKLINEFPKNYTIQKLIWINRE